MACGVDHRGLSLESEQGGAVVEKAKRAHVGAGPLGSQRTEGASAGPGQEGASALLSSNPARNLQCLPMTRSTRQVMTKAQAGGTRLGFLVQLGG